MKKTLDRLKEDTVRSLKVLIDADEKSKNKTNKVGRIIILQAYNTLAAFIQYVEALEDYCGELDEEWDKLLKSVEQAKQGEPTKKKEDKRKTQYRV